MPPTFLPDDTSNGPGPIIAVPIVVGLLIGFGILVCVCLRCGATGKKEKEKSLPALPVGAEAAPMLSANAMEQGRYGDTSVESARTRTELTRPPTYREQESSPGYTGRNQPTS
jgi:hypothetical protein